MDTVDYWVEKGFVKVARIFVSSRLKQGVDVEWYVNKEDYQKTPGVYLFTKAQEILKIGQSANLLHRINVQYKSITNSGNNRIRKEIKEKYEFVDIYAYKVPKKDHSLIGYTFAINYQKGLEEAMLKDFKNKLNRIPILNLQCN